MLIHKNRLRIITNKKALPALHANNLLSVIIRKHTFQNKHKRIYFIYYDSDGKRQNEKETKRKEHSNATTVRLQNTTRPY